MSKTNLIFIVTEAEDNVSVTELNRAVKLFGAACRFHAFDDPTGGQVIVAGANLTAKDAIEYFNAEFSPNEINEEL